MTPEEIVEKKKYDEITSLLKESISSKKTRNNIFEIIKESNYKESVINMVLKSYQDFEKYKILMKTNNILFDDAFKDNGDSAFKNFEAFNDLMQKTIRKSKANQLKKRIMSNKYTHLFNSETDEILLEMSNSEFSKKEIQDYVGKKLAAFRHPIELNSTLLNLLEVKKGWSLQETLDRVKNSDLIDGQDYIIDSIENNKLIIELRSFESANLIGSKMWCISRDESMFGYYKENEYTEYKMILDFNKEAHEELSMVAALLDINNEIKTIFTKGDEEFSETSDVIEFNELLKEVYKNKGNTIGDIILRLSSARYLENNSIGEDFFRTDNPEQLSDILKYSKDWLQKLTREDLVKCKDVLFDKDIINMFPKEGILIMNNKEVQKVFCSYNNDEDVFSSILNYQIKENKDFLKAFLSQDIFKSHAIKMLHCITEVLIDNGNEKELIDLIKDEEALKSLKDRKKTIINLVKNKKFITYIDENNIDFKLLIKNIGENYIMDSILEQTETKDDIRLASVFIPKIKNYVTDFSNFDYMKIFVIKMILTKSPEIIHHFDFSKEQDTVLLTLETLTSISNEKVFGKKNIKYEDVKTISDKLLSYIDPINISRKMGVKDIAEMYSFILFDSIENNEGYNRNKFDVINQFLIKIRQVEKIGLFGINKNAEKVNVYDVLRMQLTAPLNDFTGENGNGLRIMLKYFKENQDMFDFSKIIEFKDDPKLKIPEEIKKEFLSEVPKKRNSMKNNL